MDTWYITTEEQKKKFWDAYPHIDMQYTRKLPDPRTYAHYEWKIPVPNKGIRLVKETDKPEVFDIKYLRFHKTRVVFAIDHQPLERLFIWVQKDRV